MTSSRSFWWAIGSLPVVAVGALSPWAQALGSRVDGRHDEVVLALALVAAVMLIAFAGSPRRWFALVPLLAGVAASVVSGSDLRNVGNLAPHLRSGLVKVDTGLYLTVLGSVSLTLASLLLLVEGAGRGARRRDRSAGAGAPDYERFADDVRTFEETVLAQEPIHAGHYDAEYFVADWREGDNRYDLETRRRIEDRNPLLINEVFAPRRVLDVGCGPGLLMTLLAELGVESEGVDFSPAAKKLAPDPVRDRIAIAPATSLPHPDRSFDVVVCREVLEHLTVVEITRTVAELCRVSSRFVYVTTRFHPEPRTLLDVTTQLDVDPTHITLLAKDFLRCLFVLEGFSRRADLERRLDWAGKGRVLVYERPGTAERRRPPDR